MNVKSWSKKVKERDKNTCQDCGTTRGKMHAHHIKPQSIGGQDVLSNGITLCAKCHRARHAGELSPHELEKKRGSEVKVRDIAAILQVSSPTVRNWQRKGKIPMQMTWDYLDDLVEAITIGEIEYSNKKAGRMRQFFEVIKNTSSY